MTKTLLVCNIHFAPDSFGGATIVAENLAKNFVRFWDWNVVVITAHSDNTMPNYSTIRYAWEDVQVISINLPPNLNYRQAYKNDDFGERVRELLQLIKPDAAHVHCVQLVGANIVDELKAANIPTVVTVHDCWWICERQFMINKEGVYCNQHKISEAVCMHCVDIPDRTFIRSNYLLKTLAKADMILFPSKFHMDLHIANGFAKDKCRVNKNGIVLPGEKYKKIPTNRSKTKVRFGFTGGPGDIKGLYLIERALQEIDRSDYELVVVDAGKNIQYSWEQDLRINIPGDLRIREPYNMQSIDSFFSEIDVLLFPSQWKESFGLTVREALARDVWVISTDEGGQVEDCKADSNAYLIPMGKDPKNLKEKMELCFDKDWDNYENPFKETITTYEKQTRGVFKAIASLMG